MPNNKIHTLNGIKTIVKSKNKDLVNTIESVLLTRQVKSNCNQIANGLLMRSHVNQYSNELLTFFSDGTDYNNLKAIASWVYELNPLQDSANT